MKIFLNNKDVQLLTGTGERASRNIIQRIRKRYGKQPHTPITIRDFAQYYEVEESAIAEALGQKPMPTFNAKMLQNSPNRYGSANPLRY